MTGATHYYRKRLPGDRYLKPCRVLVRARRVKGAPANIMIEFEDGFRLVTGWRALRRLEQVG